MSDCKHWSNLALPRRSAQDLYGSRRALCFEDRELSLSGLLQKATAGSPNVTAIVCGAQRLSYTELMTRVSRVATGLAALGLARGDRIILLVSNRPEFVVALFAIQWIGAIAVPVSIREQRPGVSYISNQCGARAIIADGKLQALIPTNADATTLEHRILINNDATPLTNSSNSPNSPDESANDWAQWLATESQVSTPAVVDEQETAVILYTSGTTGRPKGAMLTHLGIVHSAMHFTICMQLPEHTRCIMAVPASHVTGLVANIITTLSTAGTLTIMPQFKADNFLRLAEQERCQFTVLVPAMYQLCLLQPDHEKYDLSDWIVGGYGGAPMPVSTIDALGNWLPTLGLMNAYGATESTSPATLMPAPLTRAYADSVGVALPCAELKVIDVNGTALPPGQVGEICIAGPMVVPGYWDNPEATTSEFVDGFWRSGDIGRIDEQGFVYVMDRKKDMLNRGGHKIYSVEVENVLMSVDSVQEAAVIGKPCPVLGERVHAVVCADPQRTKREQLQQACAEHLADYKVPESIHIQTEPLPRNANGKILKRLLRERLQASESGRA